MSNVARTLKQAETIAALYGSWPLLIVPAYSPEGVDFPIAYNLEEFIEIAQYSLDLSPTSMILIEKAMDKRVKLDFMVVPEALEKQAYVPDRVRVKIIRPEDYFIVGILGESGRKLVAGGIEFWFTRKMAEKMIKEGSAIEV